MTHTEHLRKLVQHPIGSLGLLIGMLAASASLAFAQDQGDAGQTRAGILAAERDTKAAETTPPERSMVERALYWYDNQNVLAKISAGWKGFHPAGGDFPAGAGMKYGVGFTHTTGSSWDSRQPNRIEIDARAARSTRGYARASAAVGIQRIAGTSLGARVQTQHYDFPQEDFFGLGADSRQEDRTNYLHRSTEAGAELQWKPAKQLEFSSGVFLVRPGIESGTDTRFPSTEQVFDPATLPGYLEQPDFLRHDASVALDWRDNPLHPHAGGRYSIQFSDFKDRDLNAFGFRRVAVDLQQYVPLPNRYRTVALRAAAVLTDPGAGQQVPFYFQPTLGGGQALRGFREFRFQDRNSLLLTAEYRWEASWMLDGALFVDAGTVAFDRRDLTLRKLDVSYGLGFRLHSNDAFVARLDLAVSREGFIPLLRFEHAF
jgi:hypothetical protein